MKLNVLPVVSLLTVALGATLVAQAFNIRPGAWQFTMTMEGAIPMDGIPPAMRAQMEAEMRKPKTYTSCVTAEDIKNLSLGKTDDDDDEECKTLSLKITATSGDVTRQCSGDEPHTQTAHFEAAGPQAMRATIANKSAKGTMSMTIAGKWAAAACKD